jgi:carboxyl-terminal processing protease
MVTLAACAGSAAQPPAAQSSTSEKRLFVEANQSILDYHIRKAQPEQLTIDGLAKLTTIDPQLTLERTPNTLTLKVGDQQRRFQTPAASEFADWGALSAKIIAAARQMSPKVAAVPPDQLDETVIDGTLAVLDPYSRYVRPSVAREHRATRDGFGGIGVTLDIHESDVRIAGVMPDTPAATAGLLAGDRIVSLDGIPVAQLTAEDIRQHLRGPAHSLVQLAIARDGKADPLHIAVQRTRIVPETVSLQEDDNIAWLKIKLFNQETGSRLAELLHQAHRDLGPQLRGIVLDLRDNPGGLLDQAVDVVSLFVAKGDVLTTIGRNPQAMQHFTATGDRDIETAPMAVMVNGGSASASEIVASALQDSGRAVVIGTSSYGKGTVQTVVRTSNDGELTVTWAEIITAGGYPLNTHGVVPTICTSGETDTPATATKLLANAADPVPQALAQARGSLDDQSWQHLRAICAPQREKRGIDSLVARHLLDSPVLYAHTIAGMGPAATARFATAAVSH